VRIVTGLSNRISSPDSAGTKRHHASVAALQTVQSNHGGHHIEIAADFRRHEGNPLWEELRDIALRVGPSFPIECKL